MPQLQFATLDQYIEYRTGAGRKVSKDFKPMQSRVLPTRFIRETPQYKSAGSNSGSTAKSSSKAYSGDYMVGICQMAKSNAIPVFNLEHVKEIGRMRRG